MQKTPAFCAGNVHSPGTSQERVEDDVQVLVPLVLGLSANGFSTQIPVLFVTHLCFINGFSDITSAVFIIEVYQFNCLIGISTSLFKIISGCYHTKDAASVGNDVAVFEFCSGMEDIVAVPPDHRIWRCTPEPSDPSE